MSKPFSTEEISAHLQNLKEWVYVNNAIQKEWEFKDFRTAIAFINTVAQLAEHQDHHPKIINI